MKVRFQDIPKDFILRDGNLSWRLPLKIKHAPISENHLEWCLIGKQKIEGVVVASYFSEADVSNMRSYFGRKWRNLILVPNKDHLPYFVGYHRADHLITDDDFFAFYHGHIFYCDTCDGIEINKNWLSKVREKFELPQGRFTIEGVRYS